MGQAQDAGATTSGSSATASTSIASSTAQHKIEINDTVAGWEDHARYVERIRNYSGKPIDVEIRRAFPRPRVLPEQAEADAARLPHRADDRHLPAGQEDGVAVPREDAAGLPGQAGERDSGDRRLTKGRGLHPAQSSRPWRWRSTGLAAVPRHEEPSIPPGPANWKDFDA